MDDMLTKLLFIQKMTKISKEYNNKEHDFKVTRKMTEEKKME